MSKRRANGTSAPIEEGAHVRRDDSALLAKPGAGTRPGLVQAAREAIAPRARTVDVTGLEPDAIRVVERIVERLRLGQERYGKLDIATNRRDSKAWRYEAAEEYLDGAVYACIAALAEEQGR